MNKCLLCSTKIKSTYHYGRCPREKDEWKLFVLNEELIKIMPFVYRTSLSIGKHELPVLVSDLFPSNYFCFLYSPAT